MRRGIYFALVWATVADVVTSLSPPWGCPVPPPCGCTWNDFSAHINVTHHGIDCSAQDLRESTIPLLDTIVRGAFYQANYSHNQIAHIPAGYFSPVAGRLRTLDLGQNQLRSIPKEIKNLAQLSRLLVDHNEITLSFDGGSPFPSLTTLDYLDLSYNNLGHLKQGSFVGLDNLQYVDLSSNGISYMERGVFSDTPHLHTLILSNNQIAEISPGTFAGMTSLEGLNLDGNLIGSLRQGAFSELQTMLNIELSSNPLTSLDANAFQGLSSLQSLYLRSTEVQTLPLGLLSSTPALIVLSLDHSPLTHLDKRSLLGPEHTLEVFSIERSHLQKLPEDIFLPFKNLRKLDLTGMPLTRVPNLAGLTKLNRVSILDTKIAKIYPCDLQDQQELTVLLWGSTDIVCDCDTKWMKEWFESNDVLLRTSVLMGSLAEEFADQLAWTCESPASMAGRSFQNASSNDFVCADGRESRWCEARGPSSLTGPYVSLDIVLTGDRAISVEWAINGEFTMALEYVRVRCTPRDVTKSVEIVTVPFPTSQAAVNSLSPEAHYNVCVECIGFDSETFLSNCSEVRTPPAEIPISLYAVPAAVAALVLGSMAVVIFLFKKYRLRGRARSQQPYTQDGFGIAENVNYDTILDNIHLEHSITPQDTQPMGRDDPESNPAVVATTPEGHPSKGVATPEGTSSLGLADPECQPSGAQRDLSPEEESSANTSAAAYDILVPLQLQDEDGNLYESLSRVTEGV